MNSNKEPVKSFFDKNKLSFLFRAKYNFLTLDLYYNTSLLFKHVHGNETGNYIFISKLGDVTAYYPAHKKLFLKEDSIAESTNILMHSNNVLKDYNSFVLKYQSFKFQAASLSNLLDVFREYGEIYTRLVAYFRTTRPSSIDPLVHELSESIKDLNKVDRDLVYNYFCTYVEDNPIEQERSDWINIVKSKKPEDLFEQHITKYPWLFSHTYSLDNALTSLRNRLEVDKKSTENRLLGSEVDLSRLRLIIPTLDKKTFELGTIINSFASNRLQIKVAMGAIDFILKDLFIRLCSIAGLEVTQFLNSYGYRDIIDLIEKGKRIDKDLVEKRNNFYIYKVEELKSTISYETADVNFLDESTNKFVGQVIKGICASKGKVISQVKCLGNDEIKDVLKIKKIDKGVVLVVSMTEPSLMPFIHEVAAIVTEEGGLTSHAAIISREMGIPCIIGTKIATKVLKDGDLVEVDAEKGTVTILKRA